MILFECVLLCKQFVMPTPLVHTFQTIFISLRKLIHGIRMMTSTSGLETTQMDNIYAENLYGWDHRFILIRWRIMICLKTMICSLLYLICGSLVARIKHAFTMWSGCIGNMLYYSIFIWSIRESCIGFLQMAFC